MLDLLYGGLAGSRRQWFERHPEARRRLERPVISVGNLSVGGTGKTPLVLQLAEWLLARGERPAILSRGYKRRVSSEGVTVVADGTRVLASFDRAGDEPSMLARKLPGAIVCVAEDRHLAGAVAERVLGATVHVLDDGFQHVQLWRDVDIIVTSVGEIPRGRVLPFGRLRESRAAASRAGFAVIVGADGASARTEGWEIGISQHSAARRMLGAVATGKAVAVAGIGQPEQFFGMLREAGADITETIAFPDHHRFSGEDVARIRAAVERSGATRVLTTEKDAVRLAGVTLPFELDAIGMRLALDDWDALTATIEAAIARVRASA